MPSTGQVIGDYRLMQPLGGGGFGTVWRATHERLGHPVAIKFATEVDAALIARFLREAKLVAAIKHRHVVEVIDFGTEGDEAFMIMELVTGGTVADLLARDELPDPRVGVRVIQQLLKAVDACHQAGVVHRDLKPENVFVDFDDDGHVFVKLVDFGISMVVDGEHRARGGESVVPTHETRIVGTPEYMAPEQARGATDTDHRADLYSLGVMLYELLSGRMPFDADNPSVVMAQVLLSEPKPFLALRPDLPALGAVVMRAMSKEPEDRFQSARAMRVALTEAASADLAMPGEHLGGPVTPAEARRAGATGPDGAAVAAAGARDADGLDPAGAGRATRDPDLFDSQGPSLPGARSGSLRRRVIGASIVLACVGVGAWAWTWVARSAPTASPRPEAPTTEAPVAEAPSRPDASAVETAPELPPAPMAASADRVAAPSEAEPTPTRTRRRRAAPMDTPPAEVAAAAAGMRSAPTEPSSEPPSEGAEPSTEPPSEGAEPSTEPAADTSTTTSGVVRELDF